MAKAEITALVEKLHQIWNTCDLDSISEVYAEDFIAHWPSNWGTDAHGHDGIRNSISSTWKTFPDWHEEVLDIVVGDGRAVSRHLSSGTHSATYLDN